MKLFELAYTLMNTPSKSSINTIHPVPKQQTIQVKAVPSCLGYNPANFIGTFDAFSENFGAEETIGMVTRNPNLLSVRPTGFGGAINAKSDTMTMSYIIAYTRYRK